MPANSTEDLATVGEHAYAREYFRNLIFQEILVAFKASGMTRASLARRLGRKPEQITRWFSAPGNLEIDTISDLLMAMGKRPESILRARVHASASERVARLIAITSSRGQTVPTTQLSTALKDAFFGKPINEATGSPRLSHRPSDGGYMSFGHVGTTTNAPGVLTKAHAPMHRQSASKGMSAA